MRWLLMPCSLALTLASVVAAPVPKVEPPLAVLVMDDGVPVVMRADGTGVRRLSTKAWAEPVSSATLSPDGKRVAYVLETPHPNPKVDRAVKCGKIVVRDLTDDGKGTDTGLDDYPYQWAKWTADGKALFGGWLDNGAPLEGGVATRAAAWRGWTYDLARKKRADISLHGDQQPTHQTRDGKHWVSQHIIGMGERFHIPNADRWEGEILLADTATLATKRIFGPKDGYSPVGVPAAEGKLLVRTQTTRERPQSRLLLVDIAGKPAVEIEVPKDTLIELTTDGKHILYVRQSEKAADKAQPWQLIAAEITGKNAVVIYRSAKQLKLPLPQ